MNLWGGGAGPGGGGGGGGGGGVGTPPLTTAYYKALQTDDSAATVFTVAEDGFYILGVCLFVTVPQTGAATFAIDMTFGPFNFPPVDTSSVGNGDTGPISQWFRAGDIISYTVTGTTPGTKYLILMSLSKIGS